MRHTAIIPLLLVFLVTLFGGADLRAQGESANGLRKGDWRPQDVPDGYTVAHRGRYAIQSNSDETSIEAVGDYMNRMFRIYKAFAPAKKTPKHEPLVIKLFKDRQGFLDYGGPPGAAAYYSTVDHEMVGYNTGLVGDVRTVGGTTPGSGKTPGLLDRLRQSRTMDTLGVFAHEGWHQYFHWSCGSKIEFPSWLDEGIGDYFYTCWLDDGDEMVVGGPNDARLGHVQYAIKSEKFVPFKEFVFYGQRQYYANAGQNYAQGWAMVHFFMEHPAYAKKRYVERFVKIFKDEHSIEKTVPQVFGRRFDWEKTEADWKDWIMSLSRKVDRDDPTVDEAIAANEAAGKRSEVLPANVRKAITACVAKRRPAGGEPAGGETPAGTR